MLRSFTILFAFASISSSVSAQISIVSSDLTAIGNQITRYGDTIPTYGPGVAGAGVTWDFSAAIADTVIVTDVVGVNTTPYSSTFSGSDYAMTGNGESFLYFTHTASTYTTTGAAGDLLGTGESIEAPFTDPLTLHEFPRTYQSRFDDTYEFEAEADGAAFSVYRIRLTHSGHVFDTTDAYGMLITPTGTYDVLRVRSTDFTTNVIDVKLFPLTPWTTFSTTIDTSVTYSWHAKEEMLAIAEYSYDSIGNPKQFTYSAVPPVTTVGVGSVDKGTELSVYPQPASDQLFINGLHPAGNQHAQLFSMEGKMVRNEVLNGNSLSVTDLKPGMYILRITMQDGLRREPLKFIVQ